MILYGCPATGTLKCTVIGKFTLDEIATDLLVQYFDFYETLLSC